MDRLILLRHGEAERDAASRDDFDRRLTERGSRESARVGETLAEMGLVPDLALVSSAARTRETWAAVQDSFPEARMRIEDALYLADDRIIRRVADAVGGPERTVMVVGHNPGLQELAVRLLAEGSAAPSLIAKAQGGFPTATAAVFLFDAAGRPAYDGLFFPRG